MIGYIKENQLKKKLEDMIFEMSSNLNFKLKIIQLIFLR